MTVPVLSEEIVTAIRAYFPRYATRRAVLLPALHLVHQRLGHVPLEAVVEIARILDLAPAEVQDTLSFYGFFKQDRPQGRSRIWVCRSLSCAARGSEHLLECLCRRLGIRPGETTADGRVSLESAECLGACEHAPAVLVGDELHGPMSEERLEELLRNAETGMKP